MTPTPPTTVTTHAQYGELSVRALAEALAIIFRINPEARCSLWGPWLVLDKAVALSAEAAAALEASGVNCALFARDGRTGPDGSDGVTVTVTRLLLRTPTLDEVHSFGCGYLTR